MILEEKREHTDKGWDILYRRLERDGLLPAAEEKGRSAGSARVWRRVAAAVVLVVCGVSLYLWINSGTAVEAEKRVLVNGVGEPTLVTTLEDGSIVYLSEETSIEYPAQFAGDKREISLRGDAFFEITGNRERPFIIHTSSAVIEVLGTSFNVMSKGSDTFSLSVRTGVVKVTARAGGKSIELKAGETALLDMASDELQRVRTTEPMGFANYLQRIYFKDQSIGNIVRVMNERTEGMRIKVAPEVENRLLTVPFSDESPGEIARLISLALNLTYEERPDGFYITSR